MAEDVQGEVTASKMQQALDWAYDKAVNGVAGLDSAQELAASYMKNGGNLVDNVNSLIRWQNTKAGTSGFLTGLPGGPFLPVTIPANVTSVIYVQIRMIAAIAYMGGHDLKDDKVKTMVYLCLAGNSAIDILKDVGITIGKTVAKKAIENISSKTITAINQKVAFRLVTKFGEKGVINLGKMVPVLGGIIGAAVDSTTTNVIGNFARKTFIPV